MFCDYDWRSVWHTSAAADGSEHFAVPRQLSIFYFSDIICLKCNISGDLLNVLNWQLGAQAQVIRQTTLASIPFVIYTVALC